MKAVKTQLYGRGNQHVLFMLRTPFQVGVSKLNYTLFFVSLFYSSLDIKL